MSAHVETADKVLTPSRPELAEPRPSLGARVDELQDKAETLVQRTRDQAIKLEGDVERYVQDKPMKSVLIAAGVGAGVGLVLGVLLARR